MIASRPFDSSCNGLIMSERVGILIMESISHALRRKAKIYAEVIGYGASSDAHTWFPHIRKGKEHSLQ
jgi:3-oxoacyl-[acyl-carrier-protein] synthase II